MTTSLRKKIILPVAGLLTTAGLVATISAYQLVKWETNKFLDDQLEQIARNVGPGIVGISAPQPEIEIEDRLVVQILDRAGRLVYRSGPQIALVRQPLNGLSDIGIGGTDWRIYQRGDGEHDVQVAQRLSARREIANRAALGAILPVMGVIPLAWLLIGWSINRSLRGLSAVSNDIRQRSVDAQDLFRPDSVPEEIAPLVEAINVLVERHRRALETQRRFVSDAAHELRTPLASLQIQTENLLSCELTASTREIAVELGDGVRRSSYLTSQLLEMARAESGIPEKATIIDLDALIAEAVADFVPLADLKGIHFEIDFGNAPSRVKGNARAIRTLLSILLENAVRYSNLRAPVEVKKSIFGKSLKLQVIDNGPGIPAAAMPFIYDRFFRAAPSGIAGTGLGLAIAKAIAERNGLSLSHSNREGCAGIMATIEFACENL